MSAFAELFKKADNFTVTDIHVTRKTHHPKPITTASSIKRERVIKSLF